ncbi:T Cell Receptor Beta Variable 28 [Manis pentadactyla]|nr:T Cell Receptor Beta Variable 28 [Manis pentadactyla]
MGSRLLFGVILCLIRVGLKDAAVTQFPRHVISGAGKKLTLNFSQNMNHISMYWYRQDPGFGLQLIYYSTGPNTIENGDIPDGYRVSRNEIESFSLTLGSASTNQTAVYLCASSESTALQSHILSAQKRGKPGNEGPQVS